MTIEVTTNPDGTYNLKVGNQSIEKVPRGFLAQLRNKINQELVK